MTTSNSAYIRPPANPFWEVFKTFGRDELTGGAIALVATGLIEGSFYLYNGQGVFTPLQMLCLALAGPILEKIGFFFWHFKEARDIFNQTPKEHRKPYSHYVKGAVKGGGKTLIWDLLVHDPLYVLLMLAGMSVHPGTPAWLLVPVAFGAAVVVVALLEVAFNEVCYRFFGRERRQEGFELERYLDARFYLDPSVNPHEVIAELRDKFLPDEDIKERTYNDYYFEHVSLPSYNAREGKLRLRSRDTEDGKSISTQYVYARTKESRQDVGQFRFFPREKDKHYKMYADFDLALVSAKNAALALGSKEAPNLVTFDRLMVYDRKTLFIAVDSINGELRVIELKAYPNNPDLLIEAMHYVMHRFPAMQTTHRKIELIDG